MGGRGCGGTPGGAWAAHDSLPCPGQGALTHGDRRATESRDLSKYNFENKVPGEGRGRRGGGLGPGPPDLPRLSTQYGARALGCILTTILNQTENKVPLPQGYPGGDAAFFRGELGAREGP